MTICGTVGTNIWHVNNYVFMSKMLHFLILGFPAPAVPDFHNMQKYIVDAFIAAILSFVFSAVMCKIFARKYRYEIDPNQVNTLFSAEEHAKFLVVVLQLFSGNLF